MTTMQRCTILAFSLAAPVLAKQAVAADYPTRPIRSSFPMRRAVAPTPWRVCWRSKVGESVGQTIVVENKGGAGSIVGTELVAKAEPDGYTLLLGQSGPISINPADLQEPALRSGEGLRADHHDQLLPLRPGGEPHAAGQDAAGVRGAGQKQAGKMNYGTTGVGAANHLVSELFCAKAGLKMTHIPYRGTALAVADLVAGQVTAWCSPIR